MAATGKTPILLYGSTTPTNAPTAGNLTNSSDGCEIAINVADKNLFFKDSTSVVNTVPIRQSGTSSNGWLSSTDWNTFNGKASTSSPTFSGNVTLDTGNLVIGTSGKGIDFSATSDGSGTATSELLADYEEGTWTPTDASGAGLSLTVGTAKYTKIGRMVMVQASITYPTTTNTSSAIIGGLPYTSSNTQRGGLAVGYTQTTSTLLLAVSVSQTAIDCYTLSGNATTNANLSAKLFWFSGSYTV